MSCPYFYPIARFDDQSWIQPPRLPLGDPCRGVCRADGEQSFEPGESILREYCNLGYARGRCTRFPDGGEADSVRFSVSDDSAGVVRLVYILEREWLPLRHGILEYPGIAEPPVDDTVARQAAMFVESYRKRRAPGD